MANIFRRRPLGRQSLAASFTLFGLLLATVVTRVPPVHAQTTGDPVIAAAGDIACDPASSGFHDGNGGAKACRQRYTSDLILAGAYDGVLAVGDVQYECAGSRAFQQSYDPSWGRVKGITYPAIGNHEYDTSGGTDCEPNASGYFGYWGAQAGDPSRGYYSFNIGTWHLISLNSNCSEVSCSNGSPQEEWLEDDLADNPATCTLAFFHHPRFSAGTGSYQVTKNLKQFWNDLYAAHADLVINGHRHWYERLAKGNADGISDSNGIRELIIGTGGRSLGKADTYHPLTEYRTSRFGIGRITLHDGSYDWQFLAENGSVIDSGSDTCTA